MAAVQDFTSTLARLRPALAGTRTGVRARVEILSGGTLAGYRDLPEGVYRIGARSDCDLVVPEAKTPHIATLKIEKDAAGRWTLSLVPFIEGMQLEGKPLAAFNPVKLVGASALRLDQTTLRISPLGIAGTLGDIARSAGQKVREGAASGHLGSLQGPPVARVDLPRLPEIKARPLLLVAGFLFLAALLSSFWDAFGASVLRPILGGGGTTTETRIEDAGDTLKLVRQQLATADLADHVKARLDGKAVLLEGTLTERQEDRYRALLPGLRRRTAVEILSHVRPVALPLHSQIAGVALEPVPMLIMQGGERFQVGDTLPQDWRVEAITAQGIVLSRGALRETIPLGGR
ncbi:MAG TPA: EscD/YscD/HrpQ family type III secretion system periplasmic domain-containing protein [Beijerinckiaceae bacterium]|nr:EscD/YscD/HrpQ family type III secretion system periplasmic domain-containing protein [Beijerinckiaceae bacterium]